jgi:ABC-2 type transport system permease protein
MNSSATTVSEFDARSEAPAKTSPTQPFYWSVKREIMEHRSIYIVPLVLAAVVLFGFLFALFALPHTMRTLSALNPADRRSALAQPYDFAAGMIMAGAFLVSIFYSVDALYGERRDRSVLFWKSMPVSDLATVLAKASIPLLVLPVLAFVVTLITESVMLLLSTIVLLTHGISVAPLWTELHLYQVLTMLLYHLVTAHMLWYAPFYGWLLLVSAWARRAPFLWAILPPLAIGIFERVAFHSSYCAEILGDRFSGHTDAAAMMGDFPFHPGMRLDPVAFLAAPGLWIGLAVAGLFLAGAVRLRHQRETS